MRVDAERFIIDAEVSPCGKLGGSHHTVVANDGAPPDGSAVVDSLGGRDVPSRG